MSSFPLMDDEFVIAEQVDGYSSPLQHYRTYQSSSVVSNPVGPMWWKPGDAEPTYVDDLQVTVDYPGGILDVQPDPVDVLNITEDQIITVLE